MDYTTVTTCRACDCFDLELALDLRSQPLANSYVLEAIEQPTYPLELMVCRACYHSQLSVVVRSDLMFREYLYVTGTSRTLRDHFDGMAAQALEWIGSRSARVLDLACNDGTLIEAFRRRGCEAWGVDPARNLVVLARQKGLSIVEGYWPLARDEVPGRFDLITACNVLAHVDDPRQFLREALERLAPGGAIVVEFPYARNLVLHREWDTIYHEHLSYFLAGSMLTLTESAGARVTQLQLVPVHGGSLRLALQPAADHCSEARRLAEVEAHEGLNNLDTFRALAQHVDTIGVELAAAAHRASVEGRRVVGFGASAKGSTLLNRCQVPLDYIVDDNPLKHGYLTPGRHIPIRSPAELASEPRDLAIVLLAWNFAAEIVGKVRAWRPGRNDQVIHYVPDVRVHGIAEPLPNWQK